MNTETGLLRRSINPGTTVRTAALLTLIALAPAAAHADPRPARADDTRTVKVSLTGIDLSTPEGARAAYHRVRLAAERLCVQLGDTRNIDYQETYFACVREAVDAAVRRTNVPALAAIETSQNHR